jgi:hypothetical protein
MAWRAIGAAAMAAAVLAGCGREAAPPPADPKAVLSAELNPCAEGSADPLCNDESLAPLTGAVSGALVEAAGAVSPEGSKLIVDGQRQWLASTRTACEARASAKARAVNAGEAAAPSDGSDPFLTEFQACMQSALTGRTEEAKAIVTQEGGFTFQRVETASASAVDVSIAADMGDAAPAALTSNIAFPRIDNPKNDPVITRFNAAVAQQQRFRLEDQTSEETDYKIAFASADLVSVRFNYYDYTVGAAGPNTSMKAVTINMRTGQPLTAQDVFKPGSGWEKALADKAMVSLARQLVEIEAIAKRRRPADQIKLAEEVIPRSDLSDAVVKPHLWLIAPSGLKILFPQGTFGARALGDFEVDIPWAELSAFTNPAAPAPIAPAAPAPG